MKLDPQSIEAGWLKLENQFVDRIVQKKWLKPTILLGYILVAYFVFDVWTQVNAPSWSRFTIIQDRMWAGYTLISLSFIPFFIKPFRHKPLFLFIVVFLSWLIPIYKMHALSLLAMTPIVYLLIGGFISRQQQWNRWLRLITLLILFCGVVSLLAYEAIYNFNSKVLLYFSNIHMDFLLLFFAGAIFNKSIFPLAIQFNPFQMYSPMPIPENTQLAETDLAYDKQFVYGTLEIAFGQVLFLFLMLSYKSEWIATNTNPFVQYFYFIILVMATFKSITGLLWMYGIQSISTTYFLLLAKSPIEIWQRGAVFIADFLFSKVYLSVWKKTRKLWLASGATLIAVLFHLFIFHEILMKTFLRWQFGEGLFGSFGLKEVKTWLLWLAVWTAWLLIFSLFQKLTRSIHQWAATQWVMVAVAHLGTALVFPVIYYLMGIMRF